MKISEKNPFHVILVVTFLVSLLFIGLVLIGEVEFRSLCTEQRKQQLIEQCRETHRIYLNGAIENEIRKRVTDELSDAKLAALYLLRAQFETETANDHVVYDALFLYAQHQLKAGMGIENMAEEMWFTVCLKLADSYGKGQYSSHLTEDERMKKIQKYREDVWMGLETIARRKLEENKDKEDDPDPSSPAQPLTDPNPEPCS